jgi:DNA-binding MurR/RpiR family transcriptional regulator
MIMKDIEDVPENLNGEIKYLHSIAISLKRIADMICKQPPVIDLSEAEEFAKVMRDSYGVEL